MQSYVKKHNSQESLNILQAKFSSRRDHSAVNDSFKFAPIIQQKKSLVNLLQKKSETADTRTTRLPSHIKTRAEQSSGISLNDVSVHYNSPKPQQLGALAYTQGTDIYIGAGNEHTLGHEAWHVVQQKQGRVPVTKKENEVVK